MRPMRWTYRCLRYICQIEHRHVLEICAEFFRDIPRTGGGFNQEPNYAMLDFIAGTFVLQSL